MNKSVKKITFDTKKRVYSTNKKIKPILKKTSLKTTTLPFDRINRTKKKSKYIKKTNVKSKVKSKKFTSYRKKKSKHFKSKKKDNIKNYLVKTKIIDKNTKSPDKLVDDLFQICYKDNIKISKYPKLKYNK